MTLIDEIEIWDADISNVDTTVLRKAEEKVDDCVNEPLSGKLEPVTVCKITWNERIKIK